MSVKVITTPAFLSLIVFGSSKSLQDLSAGLNIFPWFNQICKPLNHSLSDCRESSDSFLDLDIFNLSTDKAKTPPAASGTAMGTEFAIEEEVEDNAPLFWQPGKRGYYSPRIGKASPERLNAFRNIGRWVLNFAICICCQHKNSFKLKGKLII